MGEQKPVGVSWESWTESLIRQAQAEGRFSNLPGEGAPLRGTDAPYDELWWARGVLERERISFLPTALRLRGEVERALERVMALDTETAVRARIDSLSERDNLRRATHNCRPARRRAHCGPLALDATDRSRGWRHRTRTPISPGLHEPGQGDPVPGGVRGDGGCDCRRVVGTRTVKAADGAASARLPATQTGRVRAQDGVAGLAARLRLVEAHIGDAQKLGR